MTYTFKLSRRLALAPAALVLAAALGACASDMALAPAMPEAPPEAPIDGAPSTPATPVTPGQPGSGDSTATPPPSDTTVTPPASSATLVALTLTPGVDTLWYGDTLAFAATGRWSDGATGAVPATWRASGGTITGGGAYVAGTREGEFVVIATHAASGRADTAHVRVVPAIERLVVRPDSVALQPGQVQQFTAVGISTTGDTVEVAVEWGASGGTISPEGVFTAGASGSYRVWAELLGSIVRDMDGPTFLLRTTTGDARPGVSVERGSVATRAGRMIRAGVDGTIGR